MREREGGRKTPNRRSVGEREGEREGAFREVSQYLVRVQHSFRALFTNETRKRTTC